MDVIPPIHGPKRRTTSHLKQQMNISFPKPKLITSNSRPFPRPKLNLLNRTAKENICRAGTRPQSFHHRRTEITDKPAKIAGRHNSTAAAAQQKTCSPHLPKIDALATMQKIQPNQQQDGENPTPSPPNQQHTQRGSSRFPAAPQGSSVQASSGQVRASSFGTGRGWHRARSSGTASSTLAGGCTQLAPPWPPHSSRKRGTVYRSLNRNHRTESGFGDEVRFNTIQWPVRVPGRSVLSRFSDSRC
jgi:hypothetical protein